MLPAGLQAFGLRASGFNLQLFLLLFLCPLLPGQVDFIRDASAESLAVPLHWESGGSRQSFKDARWKHETMLSRSVATPLIEFDSPREFTQYVVNTPRNYSIILLFTKKVKTEGHPSCPTCVSVNRIVQWLADEYSRQNGGRPYPPQSLFFVKAHHHKVSALIQHFEVPELPALYFIPPEGKFSKVKIFGQDGDKRYRINRPYEVHKWVEKTANVKIDLGYKGLQNFNVVQYLNWILGGGLAVFYLGWGNKESLKTFQERIFNRDYVALAGLGVLIILISGHVFNSIQHPQFLLEGRGGGFIFIYPGRRVQLQAEAFIVSFVYLAFAVGFIFLLEGRRTILYMDRGRSHEEVLFGSSRVEGSSEVRGKGKDKHNKMKGLKTIKNQPAEEVNKNGTRMMVYGIVITSVAYFSILNVNYKKLS